MAKPQGEMGQAAGVAARNQHEHPGQLEQQPGFQHAQEAAREEANGSGRSQGQQQPDTGVATAAAIRARTVQPL